MNKTNYVESQKDKNQPRDNKPKVVESREDRIKRAKDGIVSRRWKKGEKIEYTTREGKKAEYPNAEGSHLVMDRHQKRGFRLISRPDARKKFKSRAATTSNYDYQVDKNGFKHEVGKKEVEKRRPAGITNHTAHRERQVKRELDKREKGNKTNG